MKGNHRYVLLKDKVMKIRKFGNICSYRLCKGKRNGAYFMGNDGALLLIFPDDKNMMYVLNSIMGIVGKLLDILRIKLWCYAYYEEFNMHTQQSEDSNG